MLFIILFINSSVAFANQVIIEGSWKLVNSYCEDERPLSGESAIELQKLIENGLVRKFGSGVTITTFNFPSFFSDSICPVEIKMGYYKVTDGNIVLISMINSNAKFYDCWATSMVFSIMKWFNKTPDAVIFYEFIFEEDRLLMFQPLVEGMTDFDCGKSIRVVEEYQRSNTNFPLIK